MEQLSMKYDIQKMLDIALQSRKNAYAPYSNFPVGACIFTEDNQYYGGCNVENTSYPMGQCAESTAVGNMILAGGKKILATLVVTDTEQGVLPCGGCLQKLSEFMATDGDIIAANLNGMFQKQKLSEIFNNQFGILFGKLKAAGQLTTL